MSRGRRVFAKKLDRELEISEFELQSRYYVHFQANTLGKGMNPLIYQLWVELYYCCSSKKITFALDHPQRLICHYNNIIRYNSFTSWIIFSYQIMLLEMSTKKQMQ